MLVSNWVHLPKHSGWKFQKIFELPPPTSDSLYKVLLLKHLENKKCLKPPPRKGSPPLKKKWWQRLPRLTRGFAALCPEHLRPTFTITQQLPLRSSQVRQVLRADLTPKMSKGNPWPIYGDWCIYIYYIYIYIIYINICILYIIYTFGCFWYGKCRYINISYMDVMG